MKVKLLVPRVGPNVKWKKNDIVTVTSEEAARMIERNQAVAVKSPSVKERAKAVLGDYEKSFSRDSGDY